MYFYANEIPVFSSESTKKAARQTSAAPPAFMIMHLFFILSLIYRSRLSRNASNAEASA